MVHATQTATIEHDAEKFDTTADELVLRVCSPARRGQIVRLKARKCTIGSSRNCTLRLAARGVKPVHCLVVRGPEATIIRCWDTDTRINGRAFTDANLNVGDRLSIGPIEFEVLHTAISHAAPSNREPEGDSRVASVRSAEQEAEQQRLQEVGETLDAKAADLERQQESLANERNKLESEKAGIQRLKDQFDNEKEQERRNLSQTKEELDAKAARLDADREALKKQRQELAQEAELLKKQQQELQQEGASLEKQRQEFHQEAESLEKPRQEMLEGIESLEKQHKELLNGIELLEKKRSEMLEEAAAFEGQRQKMLEEIEALEKRQKEAIESEPDGPTENDAQQNHAPTEAPVSLDSVLDKMGVEMTFDESSHQEPETTESKSIGQAEKSTEYETGASSVSVTPDHEAEKGRLREHEEEESIDSYMARLMDRVRSLNGSESQTPAIIKSQPVDTQKVAASKQEKPAAGPSERDTIPFQQSAAPQETQTPEQAEPEEILPRGVAPERSENLSAMRELANVSAQSAINRHTKSQFRHAARSKLLVAGIGLASGCILMYLWWFIGNRGPVFYGGLVALAVALVWGFEFAIMSGKVAVTKENADRMLSGSRNKKNEAPSDGPEASKH